MNLPIPYGRQDITAEDRAAVMEVLKDDFLTGGPRIGQFEADFAAYVGARFAVACSSGTAALHLCTLSLEVENGDTVITTPNTFVASANCVLYQGGRVDMVDIDPQSRLIDLGSLGAKLQTGKIKGIVAVDFAGHPIQMDEVRSLAHRHGCWVIEDSCHAPGGFYHDGMGNVQRCGNGAYADLAIFSFHPVKHIATGEGGMVTTNDEKLYQRLLRFRNHGITRDRSLLQEDHGPWYYEMQDLGHNYRMSDIQAALGISQLKRAKEGIKRRREIAAIYQEKLEDLPLKLPQRPVGHAFHLYVVETDRRKDLYTYLREREILPQVHYIPLHYQPYFRSLGWKKGDFPHAESYYEACLSLPIYPSLSQEQQDYVIDRIRDFFTS